MAAEATFPEHPFSELVDLIERAVDLAKRHYAAGQTELPPGLDLGDSTIRTSENGLVAWVVTQELRRSGTGLSRRPAMNTPRALRPHRVESSHRHLA